MAAVGQKILDLSGLYSKEFGLTFSKFVFNGGECHIKIDNEGYNRLHEFDVVILSRVKNAQDFLMIPVAVDALRRIPNIKDISLFIPYFPGCRQDRVMVEGEPLTVKVYANIINSLNLKQVITFDNHSDVATALINNCINIDNKGFVLDTMHYLGLKRDENLCFISPDAGSNKKMQSLTKALGISSFIRCDKVRDVSNGDIIGYEVFADSLEGKTCVIVDDICDGGATFVAISEALRKKSASKVYLIVSHGIFSKGFSQLAKTIDGIVTTNSWCDDYSMDIPEIEKGSHIVHVIKLNQLFHYV